MTQEQVPVRSMGPSGEGTWSHEGAEGRRSKQCLVSLCHGPHLMPWLCAQATQWGGCAREGQGPKEEAFRGWNLPSLVSTHGSKGLVRHENGVRLRLSIVNCLLRALISLV